MSASRIIAASTAIALGASALVAPSSFAATVGAKDEKGYCKVTYTDAEKQAGLETAKNSTAALKAALLNAYESVFKGSKAIAGDFLNEADVKQYVKASVVYYNALVNKEDTKQAEELVAAAEEKFEVVLEKYAKKAQSVGLSEEAATVFLAEIAEDEALAQVSNPKTTTPTTIKGDANAKVAGLADSLADLKIDSAGLTADQKAKITQAVKDDKALNGFKDTFAKWEQANVEAQKACAAGKATEVKYPTQVVTKDGVTLPSSIGGSSEGGSSESTDGKLSPGAIAGIVIGVLAVLGVAAVFAAPMLGIQLPFELPQLPF